MSFDYRHIFADDLALLKEKNLDKKFYALWFKILQQGILAKAKELAPELYNTAALFPLSTGKDNKHRPTFYMNKPRGRQLWFASNDINYGFSLGVMLKKKWITFKKRDKVKAVCTGGQWWKPKKYSPDIKLDAGIRSYLNIPLGDNRFFVSKTSDNKSRVYKKPLLWYQNRATGYIGVVNLKDSLSDYVFEDKEAMDKLIMRAFHTATEQIMDNYDAELRSYINRKEVNK